MDDEEEMRALRQSARFHGNLKDPLNIPEPKNTESSEKRDVSIFDEAFTRLPGSMGPPPLKKKEEDDDEMRGMFPMAFGVPKAQKKMGFNFGSISTKTASANQNAFKIASIGKRNTNSAFKIASIGKRNTNKIISAQGLDDEDESVGKISLKPSVEKNNEPVGKISLNPPTDAELIGKNSLKLSSSLLTGTSPASSSTALPQTFGPPKVDRKSPRMLATLTQYRRCLNQNRILNQNQILIITQ